MEAVAVTTDEKRCGHCGDKKPRSEFYNCSSNPDGKHNWCKECCSTYKKDYRRRNSSWLSERRKERKRAKENGLTLERPPRDTAYDITGDGFKDLAIGILKRARLDIEGKYVVVRGSKNNPKVKAMVREDALAWFEKSEQCQNFLDWLGIQTDLTYLIRGCMLERGNHKAN